MGLARSDAALCARSVPKLPSPETLTKGDGHEKTYSEIESVARSLTLLRFVLWSV